MLQIICFYVILTLIVIQNVGTESDSTRSGRFGVRMSVGARFSARALNGPGAHTVSCTMGTGSFPGIKRPGRGVDLPPLSSAKVKERIELHH